MYQAGTDFCFLTELSSVEISGLFLFLSGWFVVVLTTILGAAAGSGGGVGEEISRFIGLLSLSFFVFTSSLPVGGDSFLTFIFGIGIGIGTGIGMGNRIG